MFRTTRRAFLWIILPMVSCMVAGFLATVNGVTNLLLTLWLVVYGGCVIESIVEVDFSLGISVFLWGANLITGHVYAKLLEGFFLGGKSFSFVLYLTAMIALIGLNIAYTREFKLELRRAIRRDEIRESQEEQQEQEEQQRRN